MSRRALALAAGGVAVAAAAAIGIVIGTGVAAGRPARPGTRGWSRAPSGWRTKTVDAAGFGLHGTVPTGKEPAHVYVSPDGRSLLVANQGTEERPSATVTIVDTQTFRAVRTVETGQGAHGVVVEPTGRHAYITNTYGGNVAVLDLVEQRVVARIPVGQVPTDRRPRRSSCRCRATTTTTARWKGRWTWGEAGRTEPTELLRRFFTSPLDTDTVNHCEREIR